MAFSISLFWLFLAVGASILLLIAIVRRLRWRPAWPLRFLFLALVLAAAFLPQSRSEIEPPPGRELLVLDISDSIAPAAAAAAQDQSREWLAGRQNRVLILAGAVPAVVVGETWPQVDGRETDLAAAIDLAVDLLSGGPGRILLASDGRAADPLAVQQALRAIPGPGEGPRPDGGPGLTFDLIPLETRSDPADVFTGPLYLPSAMWEHTPFNAVLPVFVQQDTDLELVLAVNEQIVVQERLSLPAGQHLVPFSLQTGNSELMTFTAIAASAADPRPENNLSHGAMQVFAAPRVLIVTENAGRANLLSSALAQEGLDTDLMTPDDLPASLREMEIYQAVILHNFLSTSLNEAQMSMLKGYVEQLGRGLVFAGGRNAYTLGGYKDTVLETILPVRLEPPPRAQDSPLAFVLAFDRSASMGPRRLPAEQRPITLAREAAIRAVETLGPEDYLGILTYNTDSEWTIPLGPVGEGLALQQTKDAIGRVNAAGGTSIFKALNEAVAALLDAETAETRHLLLLSDGQSADGTLDEFVDLAQAANDAGLTISTIALGTAADQELMEQIAQAGKGRYYAVLEARDLPQILIDESQAARGKNVHTGTTYSQQGEPAHPVLSGFSISTLPATQGYNALTSKAALGAEDILISTDFEDPLLSVWQVGLGRVAAWMGDLGEEWSPDWTAWEGWGRLWAQLVRYTLPDPSLGSGQVEFLVYPESVEVSAQVLSSSGLPRNGVSVQFSYVDGEGQMRTFSLPQVEPGVYRQHLARPPEGVYRGVVLYEDESGFPVERAAPLVVNYPREWQPAAANEGVELEINTLTWEDLIVAVEQQGQDEAALQGLLQTLVMALVFFWPLEIAIRRRWMIWR